MYNPHGITYIITYTYVYILWIIQYYHIYIYDVCWIIIPLIINVNDISRIRYGQLMYDFRAIRYISSNPYLTSSHKGYE